MIFSDLAQRWKALQARFLPDYVAEADRLTQWRERVLLNVVLLAALMGPLALVPSLVLAIVEQLWGVVLVDLAAYGVALTLLAKYRRWPLSYRAWTACLMLYGLGLLLLLMIGPHGAGYMWLFSSSVMAGGLLGLAAGGWSLLLNLVALMIVALGISQGWLIWPSLSESPMNQWLVMVINFMFLNTLVTITTSLMLTGLKDALASEQSVSASLRQSESRYRSLSNNFPGGVLFLLDRDLRYLAAGGEGLRRLGLTARQVVGRSAQEVFPELWETIDSHCSAALAGQENHFELEYQARVYANQAMPIINDDGSISQVLVVTQDITESKATQERLKESEHRFRSFVENANDIVYALTPEGVFTYVSPNWLEFMGEPSEQAIGQAFAPYVHPEDRQACWEYLHRVLESGERQTGVEYRVFHQDGSLRWHISTGSPLRDQDSQVVSYVGIAHDVTERKQFEQEKALLEAQLRQAHKMEAVGTLAGGIAHDFNNILAAMTGYSELALDDARQGRATPVELEQILKAADRAKDLVRQILVFSRKAAYHPKPLDLNQVIGDAVSIIERAIPKMIAVELKLAPDLRPTNADATQMEQVILNLANNAQDAMPQGGKLTIETQNLFLDEQYAHSHLDVPAGAYVRLTISDTGQGMDADTLEHIFEPFYTTKEVGKGTGLGLASVYGIVKGHGGHAICSSQPGSGATFDIFLPALGPEVVPDPASLDDATLLPRGDETILLVDDEEALRTLGSSMLRGQGYQVMTAANGEEALRVFGPQGSPVDLVLMDLGMPGMGGLKCLRAILTLDPMAKVVIASGYSAEGQVKEALQEGATGYVAKPFRRAELLTTVRKVLDQQIHT